MARMIQATVFAALLFSLPAQAQHKLIGKVVPPYPEGISSDMGKCISDGDNDECYRNGVPDPAMIGIVTYQDKGGWVETDETIWAVRFDLGIQKLLIVSAAEAPQCVLPSS